MKTIDIHAHLIPRSLWNAVDARTEWHGFRHEPGDGLGTIVGGGMRTGFTSPKVRYGPEERLRRYRGRNTCRGLLILEKAISRR